MGVFFIGFFTAMGGYSFFGDYESIPTIIGALLMLFSFYLMNLNSKKNNYPKYSFKSVAPIPIVKIIINITHLFFSSLSIS